MVMDSKKKRKHRSSDSSDSNHRHSSRKKEMKHKKSHKKEKNKKKKKQKERERERPKDQVRPFREEVEDLNAPLGARPSKASDEYLGYSNEDNPFGDSKLLDTFVWKAKLDSEGRGDLPLEDVQLLQRQKMKELSAELQAVRRRRLEREREREERQKEIEREQSEKEVMYFREWEKQEDTFHLSQAKQRSRIRIAEGRAKPIDLLARYISSAEDIEEEGALEMHEPYQFLQGLSIEDLEDLLEDIKVYIELEQGKNAEYWHDITVVVEVELEKLRKLQALSGADHDGSSSGVLHRDRRASINKSVLSNIEEIIQGKSHSQLILLEKKVNDTLRRPKEGVDITFWETLQQQLKGFMARSRLRERHQENLRRKLECLKQEQGIISEPLFPAALQESQTAAATPSTSAAAAAAPSTSAAAAAAAAGSSQEGTEESSSDGEEADARELYDEARYDPLLLSMDAVEIGEVIYEADDDRKKLEFHRLQVLRTGHLSGDAEDELMSRARMGMNDEEAQFSVQAPIEDQSFLWSDKYRPRKPRFFNRVHTGFEWNKYNQTHYDIDSPPPKIVQGYKFNIFYPDLIDKNTTPSYTLTDDENDRDFAILRFKAGPPYEDIAFRIVKRDWELSYKRGFRCQFHNNIFQLWFHFKRYRYRR